MAARRQSKAQRRRASLAAKRGWETRRKRAEKERRSQAAKKGWETRRRKARQPKPKPPSSSGAKPKPKPKRQQTQPRLQGRFVSKEELKRIRRSEAAKKGWQTRRAKRAKQEKLRDAQGRFLSKEQIEARQRAVKRRQAAKKGWETRRLKKEARRRAIETRKRAEVERERRSRAAKKGWEKRRQKRLEEAFREAAKKRPDGARPSAKLRDLFMSPRWTDQSWYVFQDGQIEGQIMVAAGPEETINERFIELERQVSPIIGMEPVWVQAGVTSVPSMDIDWDKYDEIEGKAMMMTYPRRSENVGAVFAGAREIARNMQEAGFRILSLVVRVTYGDRPN